MKTKTKLIIIISAVLIVALGIGCAFFFFGVNLPKVREEAERARLIKEYYQNKLSAYQAENERRADFEVDVAFLGDSLTDGYPLEQYYLQYTVSNRGIGGETSHGLEGRMQVSLYDLKPKVAVILIGGNNLGTMLENYERMIADVKNKLPETKVILCSLTAMGGDWAHKNQIAAYNNVTIKKLAEKYCFEFVDLYTPLFDETSGEIYADFTSDGVHLTHRGYEVVTAAITPVLDKLLVESN